MSKAVKIVSSALILLLIIVATVMLASKEDPIPSPVSNNEVAQKPDIIVLSKKEELSCGLNKIGSASSPQGQALPQGQFCRIDISVKNTSRQSHDIQLEGTYLLGHDGHKYVPDYYSMGRVNNSLGQIEPKTSIDVTIVFDIPKNTKVSSIELRNTVEQKAVVITAPK